MKYFNVTPAIWDRILYDEPKFPRGHYTMNYAYNVSNMMGCMRRLYLDAVSPIRDERSPLKLWGDHGDKIQDIVMHHYMMGGRCGGIEVRGSDKDANLSYRIDMMYREDNGDLYPMEIKSANQWSFKGAKKKPIYAHYLQLHVYMHFHKNEDGVREPYGHGYLHYFSKNDDISHVYMVKYDPEVGAEIEARYHALNKYISEGVCPGVDTYSGYEGDVCKYCPYKGTELCEDIEKNTFDYCPAENDGGEDDAEGAADGKC